MLPWFTKYPNQNDEILNLDWVIRQVENLKAAYEAFLAANSLTFADPIVWNITKQYSKNTIVLSPEGDAYLSKKVVGAGIHLNNTDYWLEIFNFAEYVRTANSNLTVHVEQNTTRATASYAVNDWLIWEDVLYKVTAAISPDDFLTVGANIVHFTVEDFCRAWVTYGTNLINQYKRDIDASELQFNNTMTGLVNQYKNDIDASESAYRTQLAGDIASTTASLQAQLNAAIAGATVDSEVINIRVGADGTIYPTAGDAVRSQFSDLNSALYSAIDIEKSLNLCDQSRLTVNYLVNPENGELVSSAGSSCTDFIPIDGNVVFSADSAISNVSTVRYALYDSSRQYISGNTLLTVTYYASLNRYYGVINNTNGAFVRLSASNANAWNANKRIQIEVGTTPTPYHPYGEILESKLKYSALPDTVVEQLDELENIQEAFDLIESRNKIDESALVRGYYVNQNNGELVALDGQSATDYIPVENNVTLSAVVNIGNISATRFAIYNATKGFIDGGYFETGSVGDNGRSYGTIAIPANGKFIRISTIDQIWDGYYEIQLEEGTTPSDYYPYGYSAATIKESSLPPEIVELAKTRIFQSYSENGDISDGEYLRTDKSTSLKKNDSITFAGDITSFSKLLVGWTPSIPTTAKGTYAEINNTSIIVHGMNANGAYNATLTHGLTLSTNIQFRMTSKSDSIEVELISNGERYTGIANCWKDGQGYAFALSDGSALTDCKLSWCGSDINKKIWMFGDSYFGLTNPARWMYYCEEDGLTENALIDAYAGRASADAIIALESLIALGKPNYIVWCMGMNDGSDSSSSPSTAWEMGKNVVLSICADYGITPIFSTIPSVPNINHEQLNSWVRNSGYRYIDFAFAVGNTPNWYNGMLSSDNVHPTEKGARALYGQVIADFPEIMIV